MHHGSKARTALIVIITMLGAGLPTFAAVVAPPATSTAGATTAPSCAPQGCISLDVTTQGKINSPGDQDVYTLNITDASGDAVFPRAETGLSSNMNWNVRDSNGVTVFDDLFSDGVFGANPLFLHQGAYTVTVAGIPGKAVSNAAYSFAMWSIHPPAQPTVLSLGQIVSGGIAKPGETDWYSLTIPAGGQRIWPQVMTWLGEGTALTILDASGNVAYDLPLGCCPDARPVFLAGGTYRVIVAPRLLDTLLGHATGAYEFRLLVIPDPQTFDSTDGTTWQLGDTLSNGQRIRNGIPTNIAGMAQLDQPYAEDRYTFSVAGPTRLALTWDGSASSCSTGFVVELLMAGGGVDSLPYCSNSVVQLPQAGTYTVVVGSADYNAGDSSNGYTISSLHYSLTIATTSQTPTITTVNNVKTGIAVGAGGSGTISGAGSQDVYPLTVAAGQQTEPIYFSSTGSASTWSLFSSDGLQLFGNQGMSGANYGALGPLQAGSYSIVVAGNGGYTFGTQANAVPQAKGAVTLGAQMSGNIAAAGAQEAWTLPAVAGEQVYVQSSSPSSPNPSGLWAQLIAPDGSTVFVRQIGADFGGPVTLLQSGTYAIDVYGIGHGPSFSQYSFSVTSVASTAPPVTLTRGVTKQGSIALGSEAAYQFAAVAGDDVFVQSPSGNGYVNYALRGVDGFVLGQGATGGDLGEFRLPRTGTYSIVVYPTANGAGNFSLLVSAIAVAQANIDPSTSPTRSGVLGVGARAIYSFDGVAGESLVFSNTTPIGPQTGNRWKLVEPDGFTLFDADISWLSAGGGRITLPHTGTYSVVVYSTISAGHGTSGVYAFQVVHAPKDLGALVPSWHAIAIGDTVAAGTVTDAAGTTRIDPGAGVIEATNAMDIYKFDAVSGDAVDFVAKTCTIAARWNLRDPAGHVVFDDALAGAAGCDETGALALPLSGTYLLSVGAAAQIGNYSFTVAADASVTEPAQPGQAVPAAAITSFTPSSAPAGGTTTMTIFGTNLTAPMSIHVGNSSRQLPVTPLSAQPASGTIPGSVAQVRVDLRSAPVGSAYSVTVVTANGTLGAPGHFVVGPIADPTVNIHAPDVGMRAGASTNTFVTVANPSNSDYWNLGLLLDVPIDANVGLIAPQFPKSAVVDALEAGGAPSAAVSVVENGSFPTTEPAEVDPDGHHRLLAYIGVVPSHGSVRIDLQVTPAADAGGLTEDVNFAILPGTHRDPDASDSTFRIMIGLLQSGAGAGSARAAAVAQLASAPIPVKAADLTSGDATVIALLGLLTSAGFGKMLDALAIFVAGGEVSIPLFFAWFAYEVMIGLTLGHLAQWYFQSSHDPSDFTGSAGAGSQHLVSAGSPMDFSVPFLNDPTASAPAQVVDVRVTLPSQLDPSSLHSLTVNVAGQSATVSLSNEIGSAAILSPYNGGTNVAIDAHIDDTQSPPLLDVTFKGGVEGGTPQDFLPADTGVADPQGAGSLAFTVSTRPDATPLSHFGMNASVQFDPQFGGDTETHTLPDPANSTATYEISDDHPIAGKSMSLSSYNGLVSAKFSDPALKALSDPRVTPFAIQISSPTGTKTFVLPTNSGWTRSPSTGAIRSYRYTDRLKVNGPITSVSIDVVHGMVSISGRGANLASVFTAKPSEIDLTMSENNSTYCAQFGGKIYVSATRFVATKAPAPIACAT
jgi:hypothetical protein